MKCVSKACLFVFKAQSFGLHEAIQKLGIESRLRTAGKNKAINNPFLPRTPEDDEIMRSILTALHENFKNQVKTSRYAI